MNILSDPFVSDDVQQRQIRILFVMAWLVAGGEESEIRHLARALDPARYRIEVVPCLKTPGTGDLAQARLEKAGVTVDRTAYEMSLDDTVRYLERKIAGFGIVVSCQNVADIYPALERLQHRPPLIEHGGLLGDGVTGPKHFTARYVGISETVRAAAAVQMADRPHHALTIPLMVEMDDYRPDRRQSVRATLGLSPDDIVIGWVGRLDRTKRVEDFIAAAAKVTDPRARFVVVGGADARLPGYLHDLRTFANRLGLAARMIFLGNRADVPDLMVAMDIFVSLSRAAALPHVIAEAGAAGLPVITTRDKGASRHIRDGETALVVPHDSPGHVARAISDLVAAPDLRRRLGQGLFGHVVRTHAVPVVTSQWQDLFADLMAGPTAPAPTLFRSFVQGGFECSTQRLRSGRRVDVIASTGHDHHAEADYRQLDRLGIRTVRDGLRWHLIEPTPGQYDFSSFTAMLRASVKTGTQAIWDLLHYGWPDDIDIWSPAFVDRFARFARAAAIVMREETDQVPFWCPVNEISFFSWAGGDVQYLNPFGTGRGYELKVQLARASIAAMEVLREVDPRARFVHCEPMIAIHHDPATGRPYAEAEGWHQAQFQAYELLMGKMWPQIGGAPDFLDIIGVNYYTNNQWIHGGPPIDVEHPRYRPLSDLLFETYARYRRPMLIAETGVEGDRRADWFRYVAGEVAHARMRGVEIEGICLYPVANHLGWDDDRLCPNGLLGHLVEGRERTLHAPLAAAILDVQTRLARVR